MDEFDGYSPKEQRHLEVPTHLQPYLELPDSQLIEKVIQPVAALIYSRLRAGGRRESYAKLKPAEKNISQLEAWGYFNLPPAPGEETEMPLVYFTPRGGCEHQCLLGGCSGCAYGEESAVLKVTEEDIRRQFLGDEKREGIFKFLEKHFTDKQTANFNIVPSGSLLSPQETPINIREMVFHWVTDYQKRYPDKKVSFETEGRLDDLVLQNPDGGWQVREDLLTRMAAIGVPVTLGVGVESVNPLVAEGSFNKHLPPIEEIKKLWSLVKERYPNISLLPHVWFGAHPLLTKEQIDDAQKSLDFCIENGLVDEKGRVILMVMNHRSQSPLGKIYDDLKKELPGLRLVPPIWSVGEILRKLGKEKSSKIMIRGFVTAPQKGIVHVMPCCEKSEPLFDLLRNWRGSNEEWEKLNRIYEASDVCQHKEEWERMMAIQDEFNPPPLAARLLLGYNRLAKAVLGEEISEDLVTSGREKVTKVIGVKWDRRQSENDNA